MSFYIVKNCGALDGKIDVSGAKNAALPAIAATLLTDDKCTLYGIPCLADVSNMFEIINALGAKAVRLHSDCCEFCGNAHTAAIPYETANKLRASFLVMGPMLAKYGKVKVPLPGGCPIGSRPVDLHLKGFAALGADYSVCHGFVTVRTQGLHGGDIYLDFPSVGATENIMMAASLADGTTIIENAAVEPEISDLAVQLTKMGAEIYGAGSDKITINGKRELCGCEHKIIPDRIEAGTFMTAAAITNGTLDICNVIPSHLKPLTAKLREMGAVIVENDDMISIDCNGKIKCSDIKTLPFPGFPTDMQAQLCALMTVSKGTGIITETVFENRFMHIGELQRMGASIKIDGRTAVIDGGKKLTGAQVCSTDLRAGAALVLAGMCASGETKIENAEYIERGYENLPEKLRSVGAVIERA